MTKKSYLVYDSLSYAIYTCRNDLEEEVMQKKVAGVLGGLGPEATVDFMSKVISRTIAINTANGKKVVDQDHIQLLVDHNPTVPNRHDAIRGKGEDVGTHLANMGKRLENANADFLVMVCNTAHAFQGDIEKAISIPFVSIIDEVIAEVKNTQSKETKIGVMATQGCLEAELYQQSLNDVGYEAVVWSDAELADFMDIMYKIKSGDTGEQVQQETLASAQVLIDKGAGVLIAGCTEIPLVLHQDALSVPLLSSTDIMVDRVIDYSLGNRDI